MSTTTVREAELAREQDTSETTCCARQNVSSLERWASLGLGTALALGGISRGRGPGLAMLAVGAGLLYRGYTGHCYAYHALGISTAEENEATVIPSKQGTQIDLSVTIQRTPEELYQYWRKLENLPNIMRHIESVEMIDETRSRWTMRGPLNAKLSWEAEIFNDRPHEAIAWRTVPGSAVESAGSVHFRKLPNERGTAVRVVLDYKPLGGKLAAGLAALLGQNPQHQAEEDLRRFKAMMEAGEIPTVCGQTSGRAETAAQGATS